MTDTEQRAGRSGPGEPDVDPTPPPDAAADGVSGTEGPPNADGAGWEFLEILAALILGAESLRVIGSLIAGLINGLTPPAGADGQHVVGNAIQVAANYSDGPGIILLLVSLAMLWWRAEHWTRRLQISAEAGGLDSALPEEGTQVHRLRAMAGWTMTLFGFATVGAIAFLVGDILVTTSGHLSSGAQWQTYADDLFSVAYAVIAAGGIAASLKLIRICDEAIAAAKSEQ